MAQVELKNVDKSFGQTKVIKDVHLSIEKGEFVVFVGPSGCGNEGLPWFSNPMRSTHICLFFKTWLFH